MGIVFRDKLMVCWEDSRLEDGWSEQSDIDMEASKITTIGHFISETDRVLCIAHSVDEKTSQISGILLIPKSCIISQRPIDRLGGT